MLKVINIIIVQCMYDQLRPANCHSFRVRVKQLPHLKFMGLHVCIAFHCSHLYISNPGSVSHFAKTSACPKPTGGRGLGTGYQNMGVTSNNYLYYKQKY